MRTTTRDVLSSNEARDAILSRHEELRGLVSEAVHRADEAAAPEGNFAPLREQVVAMCRAFRTYMDFEERILSEALRDITGWGSVAQAEIEQTHERQRATLASAMSAVEPETLSPSRLVESVRAAADTLLGDLNTEDRYFLQADLDALAVDGQGG